MDQENKVVASVDPIDMTVTVTYRIHSFKALAEDIVEAIKLLNDLPGDLTSRRLANDMLCRVLSKVVDKNADNDNADNSEDKDEFEDDFGSYASK